MVRQIGLLKNEVASIFKLMPKRAMEVTQQLTTYQTWLLVCDLVYVIISIGLIVFVYVENHMDGVTRGAIALFMR
jgi:hypothetical protein